MCTNLDPPPLNLDAVRAARHEVEHREEHDPVPLHDMLEGLLGAYDALAARLAVMAAELEPDQ